MPVPAPGCKSHVPSAVPSITLKRVEHFLADGDLGDCNDLGESILSARLELGLHVGLTAGVTGSLSKSGSRGEKEPRLLCPNGLKDFAL